MIIGVCAQADTQILCASCTLYSRRSTACDNMFEMRDILRMYVDRMSLCEIECCYFTVLSSTATRFVVQSRTSLQLKPKNRKHTHHSLTHIHQPQINVRIYSNEMEWFGEMFDAHSLSLSSRCV